MIHAARILAYNECVCFARMSMSERLSLGIEITGTRLKQHNDTYMAVYLHWLIARTYLLSWTESAEALLQKFNRIQFWWSHIKQKHQRLWSREISLFFAHIYWRVISKIDEQMMEKICQHFDMKVDKSVFHVTDKLLFSEGILFSYEEY